MAEVKRRRHYGLSPHALLRRVDDEAVLLDLRSCTYYGLNATASRLCTLLGEGLDLDACCAALRDEYQVDEATLASDCDAFVQEMAALGLLLPWQEDGSATALTPL